MNKEMIVKNKWIKLLLLMIPFLVIMATCSGGLPALADEPAKAIFVGDDTLEGLSKLHDENGRFTWLYEPRKGITWIKTNEKSFVGTARRGDIIIFSAGLSEISNINKAQSYVQYYNKLATENNKRKGIKIYVKSVDPVDEAKYSAGANAKIVAWNEKIKSGLSNEVGYIDTHAMLGSSYTTQSNGYYFDDATNQKIFDFILGKVGMSTDVQIREKQAANKDLSEAAVNYWGRDKLGKRVFYDENGNIVKSTFKDIEGATYFFNKDGHYLIGLHEFEGFTTFFNDAGIMTKNGTAKVDKQHLMLFDENGHQVTGKWQEVNGKKYYIDPDGYALTGWWTIGTTDYYFTEDGSIATGVVPIDGSYYWFNEDGSARVGWYEDSGENFYFGNGGKMVTGHQTISGKNYYFKNNGVMALGWVKTDKGKYYFDLETGEAVNGKRNIDGKTYFFTKEGQLKSGWVDIDDDRYYYKEDGTTYSGRQKIGNQHYLFNENGKALSGWRDDEKDSKKKYYYDEETYELAVGWKKIDGKKYYFLEDGQAATGMKRVDGSYHFFNETGKSNFSIPVIVVNLFIFSSVSCVGFVIYRKNKQTINPIILSFIENMKKG